MGLSFQQKSIDRGSFIAMNTQTDAQQAYDLRILRAVRRITRAVALHSRQLSACSHITGPQLVCLRTVIEKGPMTATAISREVHVSASTVVGILDRLEDKGLIVRERGRADRRIVFVSATDAGRDLARDTPSPLQQKLAEALQALPELEQATITLSLERVVGLIESGTGLAPAASDPQSPMLDIPVGGVAPESGLVV
jgi:DNA-binding MarR family transcriptional regulator